VKLYFDLPYAIFKYNRRAAQIQKRLLEKSFFMPCKILNRYPDRLCAKAGFRAEIEAPEGS
jgi:hypothetical protein